MWVQGGNQPGSYFNLDRADELQVTGPDGNGNYNVQVTAGANSGAVISGPWTSDAEAAAALGKIVAALGSLGPA